MVETELTLGQPDMRNQSEQDLVEGYMIEIDQHFYFKFDQLNHVTQPLFESPDSGKQKQNCKTFSAKMKGHEETRQEL